MCLKCNTTKTSQWRAGPDGSPSLCNACGLRYKYILKQEKKNNLPESRYKIKLDFLLNSNN
eukprot:TRINITY_DN136489_c0_g1_i1.p1 TRINITY_DN136489_c0_g1~~TRINITY_DN136489_c0_g1_i1.p1  ORF type:complete len:68 (-),score=2.09 TRINITY_DN136489_c0_g1_i1:8-190(-)